MKYEYNKDGDLIVHTDFWDDLDSSLKKGVKNAGRKARVGFIADALDVLTRSATLETLQPATRDYFCNKMSATDIGNAIELIYSTTMYYDDWWYIGEENNGFFPVIDFIHKEDDIVVSFKTIDPRTYSKSALQSKLRSYVKKLSEFEVYVDGELVTNDSKVLHIVLPLGTRDAVDEESLTEYAGEINIRIEEY